MASKKFKNKVCAYCGTRGASKTGDHVFARNFFLVRERADLPQVPACNQCNNEKSQLESYLLQLLPLGANHTSAHETIHTLMPNRAAHRGNKSLRKVLHDPVESAWLIDQTGERHEHIPISIDAAKLQEWCGLVARGLAFFHWEIATPDCDVEVVPLTAEDERDILALTESMEPGGRVAETIGNGAFQYRGFKCVDGESASMWMIDLYGRMPIGGDPAVSRACAESWAVFITPAS